MINIKIIPLMNPKNKPIILLSEPRPTTLMNLEKIKPKIAEIIKAETNIAMNARILDISLEFINSSIKFAGK